MLCAPSPWVVWQGAHLAMKIGFTSLVYVTPPPPPPLPPPPPPSLGDVDSGRHPSAATAARTITEMTSCSHHAFLTIG